MVFSSIMFTFLFLPLVVLLYYLAKDKYHNYILLIASILFYAYGEPKFVLIMLTSIVLNYGIGLWIYFAKEKQDFKIAKMAMVIAVVLNIGVLFVYKYLDFAITVVNKFSPLNMSLFGIVLPIGISFFTFQALSYVIDVYRGKVAVQKNLLDLMLYVSFFPQLIAGPIVRYSTIEEQISCRIHTKEKAADGCRRFFMGFGKKVLLANNLSVVVMEIFDVSADISTINPLLLWLGAICYSLQIYFDFSGYSDMAIGLGKIFGFEFEENFNYPYISKTVTEFWRRWHMSLGQWFRDYMYIPLGGSRVSAGRNLLNLLIVWSFTGLWHGANFTFIAWGLGYFILLVLEKYFVKPEKRNNKILDIFWRVVTLLCVNFGWVIFNSPDLSYGIEYCLGMIGYFGTEVKITAEIVGYLREYGFWIVIAIICSTPICSEISKKFEEKEKLAFLRDVTEPIFCGVIFLWSVSFLILGTHNPFIYFNF